MGVSCCENKNKKNYTIENSETIWDVRNYLEMKMESAELEKQEIKLYCQDKNKIPKSVDISGFTEEDLQKRLLYLDEMKNCLNEINKLLKDHPNINIFDVKKSLEEFQIMYTWIYDDSKRYINWFTIFKNFVEIHS